MRCLYILDINPLPVISFVDTYSHSAGCLFVLLMVSFTVRKFLIRSHLFIFAFISFTLGDRSKKIFLGFMAKGFLPKLQVTLLVFSFLTSVFYVRTFTGTSNPALSSPTGNESALDLIVLMTLLSFEHRIPLLLPSNYQIFVYTSFGFGALLLSQS